MNLIVLQHHIRFYKYISIRCGLILSLFIDTGEACWWTVHPASKQRSEGEKVRVGDDLILVSVATERYLVSNFFVQGLHSVMLHMLVMSAEVA
jgi:hypothetical protein